MGVQGLLSFVEGNSQVYRDIRFSNNKLIIDGSNLYHMLYFGAGLDQRHGGEYDAFQDLIGKFIKALRDCGIEPYVVLDGGIDTSDNKYETLRKRAEDRILKANKAAFGEEANVLPSLAKQVVRQTLADLKVPFAQCYWEADREIASLASEWRCPVLSNDSDFYVFDLPAGFLPISHFKWEAVARNGNQSFIPCKRYSASSFCALFNIKRQLLPAFAALVGNDYVKLREMNIYLSFASYAPTARDRFANLEGLLRWLRDFQQPEDALVAALGLMGDMSRQKRAEVLNGLSTGMEEYRLTASHLRQFFSDGTAPPLLPDTLGVVPDWARLPLTQGRLSSDVTDVLMLHRMKLATAVDDCSLPSANLTSRPIRQVMFGLLMGGRRKLKVEEFDREGLRLTSSSVQPVVRGVAQQLKLHSLNEAEPSLRLRVLLETLGVSPTTLRKFPPHLRLPLAVTCYWLQHVAPPSELLHALLLGLLQGDHRRKKAAAGVCLPRTLTCPHWMDLGVAHAYNQWQACLKDAIHLNQLLGLPLKEPQIAWLFCGTLLHHLVMRLRKGVSPEQLFLGSPSSRRLFYSLLDTTLQYQPEGLSAPQQTPASDDLSDLFKNLQLLEVEAEEERTVGKSVVDYSCDKVLVKTRYRTKERSHKAQNPELFHKKERKGWD